MLVRPHPGDLPASPDRFFGRREELDRLLSLLRDGDRWVTIHGLGGSGKSRLAIAVASEAPWPSRWVDLAGSRTVDAACAAIAAALDVRLDGADPVARLVLGLRAPGPVLVVLDGLDDLDPDSVSALARLLGGAADARFLCTSRRPLKGKGERRFALGPLAADDAVALWIDRSGSPETPELGLLVQDLDGMPLAIEIAAAQTRYLGVPDLRRRLTDRLAVLVSDDADRPERHRSLVAAFEASATLLSADGSRVLRQLTVFRGGFRLDAAEAVVGPDVADQLRELVDASFLRLDPRGRYTLPQTVRVWAGPPDPTDEAHHGAFYARLGDRRTLDALPTAAGWEALNAERANLEVAFERAVSRDDPATIGPLALAWSTVLRRQGPGALAVLDTAAALVPSGAVRVARAVTLREGGRWEEAHAALADVLPTLDADPLLEGEALYQLGATCLQAGRRAESETYYLRALSRFRTLGASRMTGLVLAGLGLACASDVTRRDQARDAYREALAIAREIGDPVCEGMVLSNLALLDREDGRFPEARAGFEAALAVQRALGHRRAEGRTLCMIGSLAADTGDLGFARERVDAALQVHRDVGDRWFEGVATALLGQIDQADGDLYQARERLEAARAIHREVGNGRSQGAVVGNLGTLRFVQGDVDAARRAWEQALEAARVHGDRPQVGAWSTWLARIEVPRQARVRLDEAEAALRPGGPWTELGVHLCVRAEVAAALGDLPSAAVALDEAEALAVRLGVGPRSALGAALLRVRGLVRGPGADGPGPDVLRVDVDGTFQFGTSTGDLGRRHAIRRVLWALVEARRSVPGEPLDVDRLFAAGWPGELAVRDAARERVYHAVGTLRRLGLGDVVQRVEGGWRIDPAVPVTD